MKQFVMADRDVQRNALRDAAGRGGATGVALLKDSRKAGGLGR